MRSLFSGKPLTIALGLSLSSGAAVAWGVRRFDQRRRRRIDFLDKVVLVTGKSGDLGEVLALRLSALGARVVYLSSELVSDSAPYERMTCDPGVRLEVQNVVHKIEATVGEIDIVINASSSLWATIHTTLETMRGMSDRKRGRIVNIVSSVPAYGFSRGLQSELDDHGIRVTTAVSLPADEEKSVARVLRACSFGDKSVALGRVPLLSRLGYTAFPKMIPLLARGFRTSRLQSTF